MIHGTILKMDKRRTQTNRQMDQRTIKLMAMYKALHAKDEIDWLNMPRKVAERELASIEDYLEQRKTNNSSQ